MKAEEEEEEEEEVLLPLRKRINYIETDHPPPPVTGRLRRQAMTAAVDLLKKCN